MSGNIESNESDIQLIAYEELAGDPSALADRWQNYFKSGGAYIRSKSGGVGVLRLLTSADLSALEAHDADLTIIAALVATTGHFIVSRSGAWASDTIQPTDLTTPLLTPPDIGGTTPAKGYFSELREKIGGFNGIWTHANSADRTYYYPNLSGLVSVFNVASTATAAGTTTLTNASETVQIFTGVTTQIVKMPAANTLQLGHKFVIRNESTGILTIQDNSAGALTTIGASESAEFIVSDVSTAAGVWKFPAKTGSGLDVRATSPTIVSPTITKIANLTTNGVVKVGGGDGTLGTMGGELFLSAAGGTPSITNGCAPSAKWELPTNKQVVWTGDFDASAIEYMQWQVWMPANWDGSTVTFAALWTAASGSGDAIFTLEARAYANDDALDAAFGTGVDVTDTLTAALDADISPTSSAVTIAGSPAAGNPVIFRLSRKATAGGDTLAVDARVLGVKVFFGLN